MPLEANRKIYTTVEKDFYISILDDYLSELLAEHIIFFSLFAHFNMTILI